MGRSTRMSQIVLEGSGSKVPPRLKGNFYRVVVRLCRLRQSVGKSKIHTYKDECSRDEDV